MLTAFAEAVKLAPELQGPMGVRIDLLLISSSIVVLIIINFIIMNHGDLDRASRSNKLYTVVSMAVGKWLFRD
jgi:hypothetical protein